MSLTVDPKYSQNLQSSLDQQTSPHTSGGDAAPTATKPKRAPSKAKSKGPKRANSKGVKKSKKPLKSKPHSYGSTADHLDGEQPEHAREQALRMPKPSVSVEVGGWMAQLEDAEALQSARTKELLARANPKATKQGMQKHAHAHKIKRATSNTPGAGSAANNEPKSVWAMQGGTRYTPGKPGVAPHKPRQKPERESSRAQVARIKREKIEKVRRMSNAVFGSRPATARTQSGAQKPRRAETAPATFSGKPRPPNEPRRKGGNCNSSGNDGGGDENDDDAPPRAKRMSWIDVHAEVAQQHETLTMSPTNDVENLNAIEAITMAEIARFRRLAVAAEKKLSTKRAAHVWVQSTKLGPSHIGPLSVPSTIEEAIESSKELRQHPTTAACFFVMCMLARKNPRLKGNRVVSLAMHPSCLMVDPESTTKEHDHHAATLPIRRHTVKHLKLFAQGSHALASYVAGATPANGYTFDPTACRFTIDREHTRLAPGHSEAADLWEIYLTSTGVGALHRKSRCIKIQLYEGCWYVRTFTELAAPVVEPEPTQSMAEEVTRAMGMSEYAEQPKYYDGPGFQPAMNLDAMLARNKWQAKAALAKPETVLARLKRLSQAKASLKTHANDETTHELNEKFTADPRRRAVVRLGNGVTEVQHFKPGEAYDPEMHEEAIEMLGREKVKPDTLQTEDELYEEYTAATRMSFGSRVRSQEEKRYSLPTANPSAFGRK